MFEFIVALFVVLVNGMLGFVIIYKGWKSVVRRHFFFTILSIVFWTLLNFIADYFAYINVNLEYSLYFARFTLLAGGVIVFAFSNFVDNFPRVQFRKSGTLINKIFILSFILIIFLSLSSQGLNNVEIVDGQVSLKYGNGYLFYVAFAIIVMTNAFYKLFFKYKKAIGLDKIKIQYIFFGTLIASFFGIVSNLIIPLLVEDSSASRYGPYFTVFLVAFSSYSIVKHRLLDIKLVISRSLIYGLLLSSVTLTLVFSTFISSQIFRGSEPSKIIVSILFSGVVVFGLDPLKRLLSRATDKIFFQAKINYVELTQNLSRVISVELDLQKLISDLEQGLVAGLKIKNSIILLRDQDNGKTTKFRSSMRRGQGRSALTLDNSSSLIQYVREHRHLSLLESLERKIEDTPDGPEKKKGEGSKAEFARLGVALVAPIFSEDHLVAVLTLGPKLSGDSFSDGDIQLINVLAPQIGSAIQKANLYEEVREFSEGLKVKVDDATKELRDRNVSLQTLQTITKDITRTLDFGKVVQNIANAVSTELGFLGAILVFLDDDGKTLRARAVTETSLTSKAMKLLPKKFTEYTTDMSVSSTANLGTQVISSGEICFTDTMTEVLCPPLPKPVVIMMQKVMGIRTMILVPIVSEERVIGVIEVGAKRKRDEISQREIETLQSMADELGVVARNITLFDRVRKTNDQLEVANKHLQELDRAKSEFVSIASHQLRTPMTGIMGYLSMMTQGDFGKVKPEHQKILTDLLSESQRMIRLINQFLNVSKIEAGKFTYTWKPTQFEDLVEHVVKEVEKPAADKGLKLSVKMPKKKLPIIQADMDKVEDVILNLLDNAIKYTAKGTITAIVSLDNDQVHFAVKDSGIGIKPQDANELFNKFVRGSGIAQIHPDGSGLGLFIAKSIVDAHGGKIWTESEGEGKGSTFQFTLPMKPPADVEPVVLNPAAHIVKPKDTLQTLKDE